MDGPSSRVRRIAEAIASACRAHGVRHAFGVPGGGSNLDLVGALGEAGVDFVLTHAETAGALMASAAAEVTGGPSLCLATRGPGVTSLVNGAAHAMLDRLPMLLVTDCIADADRATTPHQRIDHAAVLGPVVKASMRIGVDRPADIAARALETALTPPAGPVHLDVVPDAVAAEPSGPEPEREDAAGWPPEAAALLATSRRPLFAVGVGARQVLPLVREIATRWDIPVLTTYKAKGVVPETSAVFAGMLTGAAVEREALHTCDLIIAVGVDPVELIPAPWPYTAPVLALTSWPIGDTVVPIEQELVGALPLLLDRLEAGIAGKGWVAPGRTRAMIRALTADPMLTPAAVVHDAREALPPETIATVDAGAHMLAAMELWSASPAARTLISSGLATMGYALPAAIGAALSASGSPVVCFTGDGGIGMCLAELEVVARRRLPVCVVVFNDSTLSLIKVKQGHGQGGRAAVGYRETDFAAVAAAMGVPGTRVRTREELRAAIDAYLTEPRPFLVDAAVSPGQYPEIMRLVRGV